MNETEKFNSEIARMGNLATEILDKKADIYDPREDFWLKRIMSRVFYRDFDYQRSFNSLDTPEVNARFIMRIDSSQERPAISIRESLFRDGSSSLAVHLSVIRNFNDRKDSVLDVYLPSDVSDPQRTGVKCWWMLHIGLLPYHLFRLFPEAEVVTEYLFNCLETANNVLS